jgi:hypothetical protein
MTSDYWLLSIRLTEGAPMKLSKIIVSIMTAQMLFPAFAMAQSQREMKFQELSIDSTREFTESAGSNSSIARKMTLFEMPEEYQCPLFSDSPYSDVLGAIDQMQSQLNTVFPNCENKANNDQISAKASDLRNKIFEAQKLQETGQSYKLNLTTNSIIQLTQQLQQSLSTIAQSQTKVCYRSNQQFRSVIFSMNETFQTLAPVVLDFVKNNPALAQTMGPTLKILAGADNISKGISMIEQIAKDSVMFDMSDKDNRMNTIKNVCQFMKLYRRVQYLRLSKIGQVQTVHNDFQKKLTLMNQNLEKIKSQSAVAVQDTSFKGAAAMHFSVSTDPTFDLYESLSKSLPSEIIKVQKALSDIESAKEQYNLPLISQCQTIVSIRKNQDLQNTLSNISEFSLSYGDSLDIERLTDSMKVYDQEFIQIQKNNDKKSCVELGQDWLRMANQIIFEARKLVSKYEISMSEINGEKFITEQKRISQKEKEIKNEKANYESLKTLINIAAFESAELEKRFKDMHRYLFKGPDFNEVKASCDPNDKNANCSMGTIKAAYQWYRNEGPIFELLKNDEQFFDLEYNKVNAALRDIMNFEYLMTQKEFAGKIPSGEKGFVQFMTQASTLSHLQTKFLAKNSPTYVQMCRQSNIAINSYMKATGYLASSESLCNMVYPALDAETNISNALLSYCQPTGGSPSKIQRQIMKLVGQGPALNQSNDVYRNNFKYSMKSMVDKLIQKYEDLACEQKSGLN